MTPSILGLKKGALATVIGATVLFNPLSAKEFTSQIEATDVLELYTSEGCSSCPPAERWLSTFTSKPDVFKNVIPLAFHVDYWDYIGWKDRFAKGEYSDRQRDYVRAGLSSQSYTPQLIANSAEWQRWHRGERQWKNNDKNVGVLKAKVSDDAKQVNVQFNASASNLAPSGQYVLNIAILGMGLSTDVKAGENHGERLKHDFVVLNHTKQTIASSGNQWNVAMPSIPQSGQKKNAVAVWLSQPANQKVIQATGGYL